MIKKILILCILILGLCSFFTGAAISDSEIISVSLINKIPDPARAGETVELRFKVENSGGEDANNLDLELIPEYPFTKIESEEYNKIITTLSSYQTGNNAEIIKFKVRVDKDAIKGSNEIKIKQGRVGSTTYSTYSYNIDVSGKEFAQIIYVDKAKLDPGKETKLKFTITNIGNSPLQNLVFSWNQATGVILPVYSDDTKYIKYLDVGQSADLEYTVVADVNTVAGLYQLNLKLAFEALNGSTKEINTKAGVFIGGETDFDVTFSESSAGQTSLSVANTGNNPALSVTVRIPEQNNFRVTGTTSSIIGNLDKGDYTLVSFQITQSNSIAGGVGMANRTQNRLPTNQDGQILRNQSFQRNATQNTNLKVLIEYTDTTGVRHSVDKELPIQFRSNSTSLGMGNRQGLGQSTSIWSSTTVIGSIITVIIIVIGLIFYRKRKSIMQSIKKKG